MALTPVEIRHLTPPRTTFRGYKAAATERLLEEIAASFEDVWRERADLADKVFLLTPRNVEVSAEERARLLEGGGFFNQA